MWLLCPECREEGPFEQPDCVDGHGRDCPEWFCVTCGYAILAAEAQVDLLEAEQRRHRSTRRFDAA